MASPQVDKNFTRISNELLEALASSDLSNYEFRVFMAILRKTYGYQKKNDWLSLSQLEKLTGIKIPHICRTVNKLTAKNMLIKNGKITGIQKDYEQWNITQTGSTQIGKLPKQAVPIQDIELPKQVIEITQTGNKKLPKQADTKEKKETITKETITKEKHLEFVYLTKDQHQKLITAYGEKITTAKIEALNDYIGQIGVRKASVKYTSHYHTIKNWIRMEKSKEGKNGSTSKHFENERDYSDEDRKQIERKFYGNNDE
jgi:phage replication O-like protein O